MKLSIVFGRAGKTCLLLYLIISSQLIIAQDDVSGINVANETIPGCYDAFISLMYAIGAILGLIGAVKVYQKWNTGDSDTGKVAAAWLGSCIFLVIISTVLRSFFRI